MLPELRLERRETEAALSVERDPDRSCRRFPPYEFIRMMLIRTDKDDGIT
jgi:hypothetical protein